MPILLFYKHAVVTGPFRLLVHWMVYLIGAANVELVKAPKLRATPQVMKRQILKLEPQLQRAARVMCGESATYAI